MRVCSIAGCGKPYAAKGYCNTHYRQWRKTGKISPLRVYTTLCTIEDCGKPHYGKGYCSLHWRRWSKHGDPLVFIPREQRWNNPRKGSDSPEWKGDGIGYGRAHQRIRIARGPAKDYSCIDCGGQAEHWSMRHHVPGTRYAADLRPYHPDPTAYDPRCTSCHKIYDAIPEMLLGRT